MKQTQTKETKMPDFIEFHNNGVGALYTMAPDILEREERGLRGVPFVIMYGRNVEQARKDGVPYLSKAQEEKLLEGAVTKGEWPKTVWIDGEEVPVGLLANDYVPYSFGVGHPIDVQEKYRVRTDADYQRMVNEILPAVHQEREKQRLKMERDNKLVFRILRAVGIGK